MSEINYDTLRQQILSRAAELIHTGTSGDQFAYLMRGLDLLEKTRSESIIADALDRLGTLEARVQELMALRVLSKAPIAIFGMSSYWGWSTPGGSSPDSSDVQTLFHPDSLIDLKFTLRNHRAILLRGLQGTFRVEHQAVSNAWNKPFLAWSLYCLRNKSQTTKEVSLSAYLSSNSGWSSAHAYVIANGQVLLKRTNNTYDTHDLNFGIAPGESAIVYIQNGSYHPGSNVHVLKHSVTFNLPEGVEWDYDLYTDLCT